MSYTETTGRVAAGEMGNVRPGNLFGRGRSLDSCLLSYLKAKKKESIKCRNTRMPTLLLVVSYHTITGAFMLYFYVPACCVSESCA